MNAICRLLGNTVFAVVLMVVALEGMATYTGLQVERREAAAVAQAQARLAAEAALRARVTANSEREARMLDLARGWCDGKTPKAFTAGDMRLVCEVTFGKST